MRNCICASTSWFYLGYHSAWRIFGNWRFCWKSAIVTKKHV